jgi:hypothetical protein
MAGMIETAVQVVMDTDCTVLCKSKYALGYHDNWSGFWVDKNIDILSVMQSSTVRKDAWQHPLIAMNVPVLPMTDNDVISFIFIAV